MAVAASQAGDADSSRAPGLNSGLQGSVNVHRGALFLVPQCRCTSSFVFYIMDLNNRRTGKDAPKPRTLGLLGHSVTNGSQSFVS